MKLAKLLLTLWTCLSASPLVASAPSPNSLQILTTIYPVDLLTREITKGAQDVSVTRLLAANAGCPHDYSLTTLDLKKISTADIIVANGLGLEEFLGSPEKKANPKAKVISISSKLTNLISEKPHKDHKKGHGHDHGEVNPHVFASPKLMSEMALALAEQLGTHSPKNKDLFSKNAIAYSARLLSLHEDLVALVKTLPAKRIVTHHSVFDYLARDIGLEVIGVIQEHEGQEPSPSQLLKLSKNIKKSKVAAIFTEPQYPARYGETLAKESGIPVGILDPVASGPAEAGSDYYEIAMRKNLDSLRKTLRGDSIDK
jgi:zinc transport system substrate-binding protein